MYKNMLIILGLLVFSSCSQHQPTAKVDNNVSAETKSEIKTDVQTKTKNEVKEVVKTELKEALKPEIKTEVVEEFIPEHLKHSKIEVVKHY